MNFAVLIATLSVIAMLGAMVSPGIIQLQRKSKEYSALLKLREAASGAEEWYRRNAFVLDSAPDGTSLTFGNETVYLPADSDFPEKHYIPLKSSLIRVVSLQAGSGHCIGGGFPNLDTETSSVYSDSWGDCLLLYLTPQSEAPDGIKYRDFYIVSAGDNRRIDFDGNKTGDDLVRVVSGYRIERELYDETVRKLQIIRESLENYFYSLYLSEPTRDTGVDYFLRRKTDGSEIADATLLDNSCIIAGEDPSTGDCLVSLSDVAFDVDGDGNPDTDALLDALGLAAGDLTDAWGNPILIDTASSHVRSPETGRKSPYTCRLVANAPWGDEIEVVARQKFYRGET